MGTAVSNAAACTPLPYIPTPTLNLRGKGPGTRRASFTRIAPYIANVYVNRVDKQGPFGGTVHLYTRILTGCGENSGAVYIS